jgi:predicted transcriptional regulator
MAKKSLKKRMDDLIDALGRAQKPTLADIRSELVSLRPLAESLEDGQALAEKETTITGLKEENENLKVELQMANTELDTFRAERKKQEEEKKREEIPRIQFQILQRLPLVHENGHRLDPIARAAGIPMDEAEIHLDALCKAKLAKKNSNWPRVNAPTWQRTMRGNKLVVAKRLAGEEGEKEQKTYKYSDLPKIQHDALVMLPGEEDGIYESKIIQRLGKSTALVRRNLRLLREAGMATDEPPGSEIVATYQSEDAPWSPTWILLPKGEDYLAERDLL